MEQRWRVAGLAAAAAASCLGIALVWWRQRQQKLLENSQLEDETALLRELGPAGFYELKNRQGSVVFTRVNGHDSVVVFGVENMRELERLERLDKVGTGFSAQVIELLGENSLASLNGKGHRLARQRITRVLSHESLANNLRSINSQISKHICQLASQDVIDLTQELHQLVWLVMSNVLCGEEFFGDKKVALRHLHKFGRGLSSRATPEVSTAARKSRDWFHARFRAALQENKNNGSVLLEKLQGARDEENGSLSELAVLESATLLLFASVDTTASLLLNLLRHLIANPRVFQVAVSQVQEFYQSRSPTTNITLSDLDSLKYLDACIRETLAHDPPFASVHRVAFENIQLGGYSIPKGVSIDMALTRTVRDALRDDIESELDFFPERWLEPNAARQLTQRGCSPFGWGPHSCPGARFPPAEAKLFFLELVNRFHVGIVELPSAWSHRPALLPSIGHFLVRLAPRENHFGEQMIHLSNS